MRGRSSRSSAHRSRRVRPSRRGAARQPRVMVFQWPWNGPDLRSPRGQRPRSRTKLVLAGGLVDKHRIWRDQAGLACEFSAAAPVPRPPVLARSRAGFFLTVTLCRSKNRQTAVRLPGIRCLRIAATISIQGRIRLLGYQSQQPFHLLLQRRRDSRRSALLWCLRCAATPALQPPHRRTGAQAEAFGRFPPRCSGHDGFDNAFPQVIRLGLASYLVPQNSESILRENSLDSRTIGRSRIQLCLSL